jgi:hypothetical protein
VHSGVLQTCYSITVAGAAPAWFAEERTHRLPISIHGKNPQIPEALVPGQYRHGGVKLQDGGFTQNLNPFTPIAKVFQALFWTNGSFGSGTKKNTAYLVVLKSEHESAVNRSSYKSPG